MLDINMLLGALFAVLIGVVSFFIGKHFGEEIGLRKGVNLILSKVVKSGGFEELKKVVALIGGKVEQEDISG